jgi:hypothetical protein
MPLRRPLFSKAEIASTLATALLGVATVFQLLSVQSRFLVEDDRTSVTAAATDAGSPLATSGGYRTARARPIIRDDSDPELVAHCHGAPIVNGNPRAVRTTQWRILRSRNAVDPFGAFALVPTHGWMDGRHSE